MRKFLNILIADDMHPALMEGLQNADIKYSYLPDLNSAQLPELMATHNAIVVRSKINADKTFLESCPKLYFVARAGAGLDNIDLETAKELGIVCFNAGEGNRDAVGEHTVGMLLNLATNINKGHQEVANRIWDREGNRGFEVGSKTIGIIGFGNTGSAVAQKLSGFGCRMMAYDKYRSGFGTNEVEEVSLETLINNCDVISFHVPLTIETTDWINNSFIHSVKKPFILLNHSRGGIMNTRDILNALKDKKILAFGTDVLENEKLETQTLNEQNQLHELCSMPNVCITPHVAGWTTESYKRISEVILKNILVYIEDSKGFLSQFNKEEHFV